MPIVKTEDRFHGETLEELKFLEKLGTFCCKAYFRDHKEDPDDRALRLLNNYYDSMFSRARWGHIDRMVIEDKVEEMIRARVK